MGSPYQTIADLDATAEEARARAARDGLPLTEESVRQVGELLGHWVRLVFFKI